MPGITKDRYQEIAETAAQIVTEAGGLAVDDTPQSERRPLLTQLANKLIAAEQVDRRTARGHIARAFRRMRYDVVVATGWGGGERRGGRAGRQREREKRLDSPASPTGLFSSP